MKPRANKRKGGIKIRTKISEMENRKTAEKIKKPKVGSLERSIKLTNL